MYINFGQRQLNKAQLHNSAEAACFSYKPSRDYSRTDEVEKEVSDMSFYVSDTTRQVLWGDKELNEISEFVWLKGDSMRITEPISTIDWQMKEETREIGGFHCNKAVCRFRGRNYTVWFTLDVPCSWGPWKLHGLPGAVLEAYDDTNEVSFYATGVDRKEIRIVRPDEKKYKVIGREEYKRMFGKTLSEMMKRVASRMGEGIKVSVSAPKLKSIEMDEE